MFTKTKITKTNWVVEYITQCMLVWDLWFTITNLVLGDDSAARFYYKFNLSYNIFKRIHDLNQTVLSRLVQWCHRRNPWS